MKYINIFLTLLLLFTIEVAYPTDMKFFNVNSLRGISMREANSVLKDDNGFIWVSSKTGILRLTDDDYRIYQLPFETANIISVKLLYDQKKLVAYTNNGQIFHFNSINDRFEVLVNVRSELNNNHISINSVLADPHGAYWISSSVGLLQFKENKLEPVANYEGVPSRSIWFDAEKLIVVDYKEISLLNITDLSHKTIYKAKENEAIESSKLYIDKKLNKLWIGTSSNGLFWFDFNTQQLKKASAQSIPMQPILAIVDYSENSLLLGIDGQGLWEISKDGSKVLNIYKEDADYIYSLRGNGVYDIYCDDDKRVWVATYSGGISYFDRAVPSVLQISHQVNNSNSLVNNDVNDVLEDSKGNLWFATNNGISCWNVSTNQWRSFYVNKQEQAQVFLTLCEDNTGRIWAGTYSSGVYVIDINSGKELAHYSKNENPSPFINEYVFDIFKDSRGDIWIGGINSEVVRFQHKENLFRKYSVQPIYVLQELNQSQMLFGCTYGLGISNNESGAFSTLINGCIVHDIFVKDGYIWVATSGDGLIRFDMKNNVSTNFTVHNGLPSNFVNSVEYSDGFLWLGTENGMCRFDPKEEKALVYSSILSLSNNSFNRNAHWKLKNGQLAWGTNNGVVIFNPKTIIQYQSTGKIFLQDISVSGRSLRDIDAFGLSKPLDQLESIKLKHNQNTITIELVPIGVGSGSKFSWKLEGLDEDWSQPASHRMLSYSNIQSKEYDLKIRLYDNSLSQIIAERTLKIKVTPPFWATYWFLIIIFILISSIIYSVFWYYINQLKQKHTEEKVRFFTNTAHDIRTSLTLIKAPMEEMNNEENLSQKGRHFLKLASEQVLRLSSVVTQLMEFQKVDVGKEQMLFKMHDLVSFLQHRLQMFESLAQSRELSIVFSTNTPSYITAFDETMMEKIVDNLLSNALKYSLPGKQIKVLLSTSELKWDLEVADQGIGINKKEQRQLFKEFFRAENAVNSKVVGSGIGLLLVKNYVKLHNGQINFSSQENVGSSFIISVPYKSVESISENEEILIDYNESQDINENEIVESVGSKESRLLIVEDNDELLQFLSIALSDEFDVITASDGEEAWKIIQKQLPDIVVSDIMMPKFNGFQLCEIIKSTNETSHIPVVLLTALTGKAEQLQGLGLGADDYLTKPFDMTLLRQKIKSIIQNREAVKDKTIRLLRGNKTESIVVNELNDTFLKKMLEVVNENLSNSDFGKDEFASAMNVSTSLLYKKIKALTNQSPTDFMRVVRLDNAHNLLQSGKYSVTEVSEMCGFASVGYFSTVFKKHFGKSPTEVID